MDRVHYETYATGDDMYDTMDTYETDMDSTHDDIKASEKEVKSFQLQNLIKKEKYLKLVWMSVSEIDFYRTVKMFRMPPDRDVEKRYH